MQERVSSSLTPSISEHQRGNTEPPLVISFIYSCRLLQPLTCLQKRYQQIILSARSNPNNQSNINKHAYQHLQLFKHLSRPHQFHLNPYPQPILPSNQIKIERKKEPSSKVMRIIKDRSKQRFYLIQILLLKILNLILLQRFYQILCCFPLQGL